MSITIYFETPDHQIEPVTGEALAERLRHLQPGKFTFTTRPAASGEILLWADSIGIINENITPV
jgi:hypothetical protein